MINNYMNSACSGRRNPYYYEHCYRGDIYYWYFKWYYHYCIQYITTTTIATTNNDDDYKNTRIFSTYLCGIYSSSEAKVLTVYNQEYNVIIDNIGFDDIIVIEHFVKPFPPVALVDPHLLCGLLPCRRHDPLSVSEGTPALMSIHQEHSL